MNFNHASQAFRRLNPHLFPVGGVPTPEPQRRGQRLPAPAPRPQTRRQNRLVVSLVIFRQRPCDDDNLSGGCKWLRDAIAASLGLDDGDPRLRFEYHQVITTGRRGVLVKIDRL